MTPKTEAAMQQALEVLEFYENDNHVLHATGPDCVKSLESDGAYTCVNAYANLYVERGREMNCPDEYEIEDDESEPVCHNCHGDGCDPYTDYLLPCPICQGEQQL